MARRTILTTALIVTADRVRLPTTTVSLFPILLVDMILHREYPPIDRLTLRQYAAKILQREPTRVYLSRLVLALDLNATFQHLLSSMVADLCHQKPRRIFTRTLLTRPCLTTLQSLLQQSSLICSKESLQMLSNAE